MKRGKNLISWAAALILGLSLILVPVVSRVSPVQAAVTWTKYSGEVTLDSELYVLDAWVIKESSTSYRMWYTHGKKDMPFSELIDDIKGLSFDMIIESIESLDPETFLEDLSDLEGDVSAIADILDGISTVIGYATSTNGTTWTVVNSEVLAGGNGAWNSIGAPSVIWDATDSEYKMWYTRLKTDVDQTALEDILFDMGGSTADQKAAIQDLLDGTHTVIGYATSPDGITWTVENSEVLAGNGQAINSVGAASVIWDATDSKYKMWYTRGESDFAESDLDDILADITDFGLVVDDVLAVLDSSSTVIGYATSSDGTTWTVVDSEVLAGNGVAWDSVADPSVIKSGGTYEMWYTKSETNLIKGNLLSLIDEMTVDLGPGILTLWDDLASKSLLDFIIEDVLTLGITNISDILSGTNAVIGYATSSDGIIWTPQIAPDLVGSSSPWGSVVAPSVVKTSDEYEMWYTEGIGELTWLNLLGLVLGDDLPIGYAYYTPSEPSGSAPPPEEEEIIPEEEEVIPEEEEIIPEEEEVIPEEEVTPRDIEDIAEEDIEAVVVIIEDMAEEDIEVVADIFEEISIETAVNIIEEVSTETAVDIIEEVSTETAVDIIEEVSTETAVNIIEEVSTETAVDIIEEVSTETAVNIIEEVSTETAVDIIEEVTTETAVDIIEEVSTETAVNIIEEVSTETAVDIMEEVSTDTLNGLVGEMSEESLMDTLPEVSTDTLHSVDVETLFDALPNVPTEQLTSEDPPLPPDDLTDPIVRYVTPSGAQYVAIRTHAGEWVVVMATPEPLDKLMIKTNKALKDVGTTVEILDELPSEVTVELPAGQIVMKYINISFENAESKDIELGHLGFHVENEWLEQNSIHKWSVTLNQYDPDLGQWIALPTKRIGEDDTYVYYTVVVTHFSTFAISGSQVVSPMEFKASNLAIDSGGVLQAGEDVTISADVTNLSNTAGTYAVTLWIDGTVEAGKNVSLEASETIPVSFTVIRNVEGTYQVRIDRLLGDFKVIGIPEAPLAWWIWLIIGLGIVVIGGLLAYFLWWRR